MTATQSLRPEHSAVRTAREFCRAQLQAEVPRTMSASAMAGFADDAALVVSELVTNAIRAHASVIELEVGRVGGLFLIAVTDDAAELPAMTELQPTAVTGRGLHIVDVLSSQWGVDAGAGCKRVWAQLPVPVTRRNGDSRFRPS